MSRAGTAPGQCQPCREIPFPLPVPLQSSSATSSWPEISGGTWGFGILCSPQVLSRESRDRGDSRGRGDSRDRGRAGTAGCAPSPPAKLSQSQPGSAAAQSCVFNSPRDIPVPSRLQGAVKVAGLLRCHHPPSLHHLCHPMPPDWDGTDENRRERRVCFCSQNLIKEPY